MQMNLSIFITGSFNGEYWRDNECGDVEQTDNECRDVAETDNEFRTAEQDFHDGLIDKIIDHKNYRL